MDEKQLRKQIANEIREYAEAGYQGALTSDSAYILTIAEYIKVALLNAALVAEGLDG